MVPDPHRLVVLVRIAVEGISVGDHYELEMRDFTVKLIEEDIRRLASDRTLLFQGVGYRGEVYGTPRPFEEGRQEKPSSPPDGYSDPVPGCSRCCGSGWEPVSGGFDDLLHPEWYPCLCLVAKS